MKKFVSMMMALVLVLGLAAGAAASGVQATASAQVRIAPDRALLSLGVSERDLDVQAAQRSVNERIESVRQALYAEGIEPKDISVDSIYMYTNYDYSEGEEKINGYNVSHQIAVTVRELDKLGTLIDAALAAGANQLNGVSFDLDNNADAYAEALALAVQGAMEHAKVMADAAGIRLGELESITEGAESWSAYATKTSNAAYDEAAGTSVDVGGMTVSATATVVYDVIDD